MVLIEKFSYIYSAAWEGQMKPNRTELPTPVLQGKAWGMRCHVGLPKASLS